MPGRNGTGPTGEGSRTGRGMGNCRSDIMNDTSSIPRRNSDPYVPAGSRPTGSLLGRLFRRRRFRNRY